MTIQIGVCAMRDPHTGAFVQSKPLYGESEDVDLQARDRMIRAAGKMFAEWIEEDR